MAEGWRLQGLRSGARCGTRVVNPERCVVATCDEPGAVWREGDGVDAALVPAERQRESAGGDIPDLDRGVVTAGYEAAPVQRERQRPAGA